MASLLVVGTSLRAPGNPATDDDLGLLGRSHHGAGSQLLHHVHSRMPVTALPSITPTAFTPSVSSSCRSPTTATACEGYTTGSGRRPLLLRRKSCAPFGNGWHRAGDAQDHSRSRTGSTT